MLAVLLVGCGEEMPEALTEQATGIDVEIGERDAPPPEDGEPAGDASPDQETYPDALPEELPLPDGTELLGSSVEDADGATVVSFEAAVDGDFDATALFYDTELPAAGWTIVDKVETDEDANPTERWQVEGFGWSGHVEVRQRGDSGDAGDRTTMVVELRQTS